MYGSPGGTSYFNTSDLSKKSLQGFHIMLEVRKLEVWKLEVRKLEVKSDEVRNVEVRSMEVRSQKY